MVYASALALGPWHQHLSSGKLLFAGRIAHLALMCLGNTGWLPPAAGDTLWEGAATILGKGFQQVQVEAALLGLAGAVDLGLPGSWRLVVKCGPWLAEQVLAGRVCMHGVVASNQSRRGQALIKLCSKNQNVLRMLSMAPCVMCSWRAPQRPQAAWSAGWCRRRGSA
jgi:hypothetical protein